MSPADHSFRRMLRADLGAVARIEADAEADPWSREVFQRYLARQGVIAEVLVSAKDVCAYYLVELEARRVHVLNVAVATAFRRRGLATAVMARVEEVAREREQARIELEVRETNLAAQLLYKQCGYLAVGVLRGHYQGEDGYLMRRELPALPSLL